MWPINPPNQQKEKHLMNKSSEDFQLLVAFSMYNKDLLKALTKFLIGIVYHFEK